MSTKRNAPELLPATRLEAVKAYAQKNYEKGGWDYVIECWSDAQILDATAGSKTIIGALRMVSAQVKVMADYRDDIQAEGKLEREELVACIKEERDWAMEQGKAKADDAVRKES